MGRIIRKISLGFAIFLLILTSYFFIGRAPQAEKIVWGVNFSQKHATSLGLDWRDSYLALLDNLGVRNIKLATHWDLLEKERGQYDFEDLDWQIEKAQDYGAEVFLVIGMKTPRWPECHVPDWAKSLSGKEQQEEILGLLEEIVSRYEDRVLLWAWQVENEPFFPFGECPRVSKDFLKKEINLVKSLDSRDRPVIVSESGEFPLWIEAARYGDIVGVTMYKKAWFGQLGAYITYHFPPVFYHRKAEIISKLFNKEVIGVELQAEPWVPDLIYNASLEEQEKTMNLERFKYNVEFARKTGLSQHYLWGAEWWYWMKEKQEKPEIWEEARKLF